MARRCERTDQGLDFWQRRPGRKTPRAEGLANVTTELVTLRVLTDERSHQPPGDLVRALGAPDSRVADGANPIELPGVLAALPEGVIVLGIDGLVWAANDAARGLLGRSPLFGGPAADALDSLIGPGGEPLRADHWPIANARAGETVTEMELTVQQRTGDAADVSAEVPVIASIAPIHGPRGIVGVILTMQPIPRIRKNERRWEEFVTTVVHESRGALSAILGCVNLLETLAKEPIRPRRLPGYVDPETQFLGMVKSDTWQISAMLTELLDVVRIGAHDLRLELQPVDVVALVEDVVEHLAPNTGTLTTGHRLKFARRRLVPIVQADASRIEQVLTAFVTTLARYSPPGSEIDLTVEPSGDAVVVAAASRQGHVQPAELSRLFDEYARRQDLRNGARSLGPSLFVARGLVEAHGGHVWAESVTGRGTAFRFSLPMR